MTNNGTLKEKIYKTTLESIVSGKFQEGKVITEKQMMQIHQVSRSPVREALVELCKTGVLKSLPRYGYEIVQLGIRDIRDTLDFRVILESGALRRSMNWITGGRIEALEEIDRRCVSEKAKNDLWYHWNCNREFHLKIMSYYENPFAYRSLENALETLTRAYAQNYWNKWDGSAVLLDTKSHQKIISCIRDKDVENAIYHIKQDIGDFNLL